MGAIRAIVAALTAAVVGFGALQGVHAAGLTPAQSDSACAAHVQGRDLNDYVKACAVLIAQLKDTLAKCRNVASLPESARGSADPQGFCDPKQLSLLGDQLAAAYNDRAYFLIQCRGSENYRLAVADLDEALKLLPNYWLAVRNRAIAYMLLGEHAKAKADFASLITAMANGDGSVLIRQTGEAEVRLGLGFAALGMCEVAPAQDAFVETERLSIAPIGADPWVRAAALFGQGLGLKLKGSAQERIANTNTAITPSERARLMRYAGDLKAQGESKMQAARALVHTIDADVKDRFYIEETVVITKCRDSKLSA